MRVGFVLRSAEIKPLFFDLFLLKKHWQQQRSDCVSTIHGHFLLPPPIQFNSIHCMRSMMWETALLGSVAFSSPWSPWWEVFCIRTVIILSPHKKDDVMSFSSVKPPPCQWCAKTPSQLNGCVCVRVHHWWSFHGSRKQTSPFVRKKYCWTKRPPS